MKTPILPAAALLVLACAGASAEVADSAAGGFTVKIAVRIQGAPADVYRRFLRVGDWWNPQHTYSGDAHNLSIEEKAGGCFCEKLPNGGGARHMEVVTVMPGKMLVLHGTLGPLQSMGAVGSMSLQLSADGDGTKLALTYAVSGYFSAGMNALAAPVDSVLSEQIGRLKNLIEKGTPK